jgi:hypothetical protein
MRIRGEPRCRGRTRRHTGSAASQIEHALVFHAARWWYLAGMRRWRHDDPTSYVRCWKTRARAAEVGNGKEIASVPRFDPNR